MFQIYGTSGQMLLVPVEQLRTVGRTARTARVRRVADRGDTEPVQPWAGGSPGGFHSVPEQAVHAYASTQQPAPARHPLSRVDDVMSRDLIVLPDTVTVWQAMQRLSSEGVSQAPVVNAQQRLVGMISTADFMQPDRLPDPELNALVWRARMAQPVTEWMVSPVPSVAPDTDIRRLALALHETGLSGLPVVVSDGVVVGFVSRSDILQAVTHDPPLDLWAR